MQELDIFFASDDNYAPYLATAIYSIMSNTKEYVHFYILDGGISENSKSLIEKTLLSFDNYSIEYLDMKEFDLSRFPDIKHYSLNTFSRYFIPILKPNLKKILYLDVDIIVKSDIAELYNQDLEGKPVGAILEDFYGKNATYIKENIYPTFSSGTKSFNAGVMLLDIEQFVKHNYSQILIDKTIEYIDKLNCPDQDIFNIVFENNYKVLDYKYNFMIDMYDMFSEFYPKIAKETLDNHVIIHYVTKKPWKTKKSAGFKDFDYYAKQTAFADVVYDNKTHKVVNILGIKIKIRK